MPANWPPKQTFLECISKSPDYPQRLKDLRKQDKKSQKHVAEPGKRLQRQGYHQWRGPKYISLHNGRGVYDQAPWSKLPGNASAAAKKSPPTEHRIWKVIGEQDQGAWDRMAKFPEGSGFPGRKHFFDMLSFTILPPSEKRDEEVRFGSAYHKPYSWTPHHLLPAEHVSTGTPATTRAFSDLSLEFIDLSFWELDNGHNLMLLPRSPFSECAYHCLPGHVQGGSHPQYRLWVANELKSLDRALTAEARKLKQQQEQNQKKHDDFLDIIVDKLYEAEGKFWDRLKRLGKDYVAGLILRGQGPQRSELLQLLKGRKWGQLG